MEIKYERDNYHHMFQNSIQVVSKVKLDMTSNFWIQIAYAFVTNYYWERFIFMPNACFISVYLS